MNILFYEDLDHHFHENFNDNLNDHLMRSLMRIYDMMGNFQVRIGKIMTKPVDDSIFGSHGHGYKGRQMSP